MILTIFSVSLQRVNLGMEEDFVTFPVTVNAVIVCVRCTVRQILDVQDGVIQDGRMSLKTVRMVS